MFRNTYIHNLPKSHTNQKHWLIDNESGLLDAYLRMYDPMGRFGPELNQMHSKMLKTMCIFNRNTVQHVERLADMNDPAKFLLSQIHQAETAFEDIRNSRAEDDNILHLFTSHFHTRLKDVQNWIDECRVR